MAVLRNKTTSEGVIVRWQPHPDHSRPSTYQVADQAVSLLDDLGFSVPNPGDEVEMPEEVCRPLRKLEDLYFKSESTGEVQTGDIEPVGDDFAQSLSDAQRQRLQKYITTHKGYTEQSEVLQDDVSSLSTGAGPDDKVNSSVMELEEGDRFSATIDRQSSSGNGIIDQESGHINVGPITRNAVGTTIEAEAVTHSFAICLTEEARGENYAADFWRVNPNVFHRLGRATISATKFCDDCGSISLKKGERWVCSACEQPSSERENKNKTGLGSEQSELLSLGKILQDVSVTLDSRGNLCVKNEESVKINGDINLREEVDLEVQTQRNGYVVATVLESRPGTTGESDIERLRQAAVEDANKAPLQKSTRKNSADTRYSRSQKVKEYVKARADGACEGCNEPAPFKNKRGEPYLHAHHLHELSDGGADTPDTVIALCPNCHYRIHHGEDGDEYNQQLIQRLDEIESS